MYYENQINYIQPEEELFLLLIVIAIFLLIKENLPSFFNVFSIVLASVFTTLSFLRLLDLILIPFY